jgi:cysteine desulfurase family protein (TIGR01976 family)
MSNSVQEPQFDVSWCRDRFPALSRKIGNLPAVYFDGPAGSQVPQSVVDAVGNYMLTMNANHGGVYKTSRDSDLLLEKAHRGLADFLGADDPGEVVFGPNMTSLTFAISRALARTWQAGDEIIVSRLDHDANVTPWVLAARDAGVTVHHLEIHPTDCTLDMKDLAAKLSPRTRLVAVGFASNAVGTINPVREIARMAHEVGALVYIDAVHYAPHALIDVGDCDCDFLACSAYKFFGPHVGILWGRRHLLEELPAYKIRPAPDDIPGRWMTGTQNHECIAGALAAVDYLADLGRSLDTDTTDRRAALKTAYRAITAHERVLIEQLLDGLEQIPEIKIWGITDRSRLAQRVPTLGVTHARLSPVELARYLDQRGIFTWHGNFYALPLTDALGLEPDGMVRIGILHYNTAEEVQRLLQALETV